MGRSGGSFLNPQQRPPAISSSAQESTSVSGESWEPLCYTPFSQVVSDRRRGRERSLGVQLNVLFRHFDSATAPRVAPPPALTSHCMRAFTCIHASPSTPMTHLAACPVQAASSRTSCSASSSRGACRRWRWRWALVAGVGHAAPGCVTAWCWGGSALLLGAQQREGVVDALLEDLVGELSVGQGAGELQGPDHQGEDAEGLGACRGRILGGQAGGDVVDHGEQAVGVGPLDRVGAAPDLIQQGGGRAAVVGVVTVLDRQVRPNVLLNSGAARRQRAEALAVVVELVGDRG